MNWTAWLLSQLLLATGAAPPEETTPAAGATATEAAPPQGEALPEITRLPAVKRFVEAPYPERARAEGVEAVVLLLIDINAEGRVERAEVLEPAEPAGYGFDEAALAAVRDIEFEPARAGDEAVPVQITYRYGFELTAPPPASPAERQAPARVVNFEGRLLERGTRAPVVGAVVTVFRALDGRQVGFDATTDAEGGFRFVDLEPGEWRVLAAASGYYPVRTTETIEAGEKLEARYYIERVAYNPYDVLVEAERPQKEVTRRTLQTQEIEKIPGTFGDPVHVVSNMPGVARGGAGMTGGYASGLLVIRGSAPEDSRAFIDAVEVPMIFHFGNLRSVVPAGMLELVDFYPGNFSVYYGRATGGIIDIEPKRLAPDGIGGYVDVNLYDAGLYVEAPLGEDGAIAIAGRRSYIDMLLKVAIPDDAAVAMNAVRYYDYQLHATYRPAPGHELTFLGYGSDDRLELILKNPADMGVMLTASKEHVASWFYRGNLAHTWRPAAGVENEIKLGVGRDGMNLYFGELSRARTDTLSLHGRETLRWQLVERLALTAGVDAVVTWADWKVQTIGGPPKEGDTAYYDPSPTTMGTEASTQSPSVAAFLEASVRPTEGLELIPGLRVDRFGMVREITLDPRLAVRLALGEAVTFKGGAGIFHQEPTADELDEGYGNPELATERAVHYSVGAEVRPLPQVSLDVTGFYKQLDHLVTRSDDLVERDGETVPEIYDNAADGRVYGLDVLLRHEMGGDFYGWLAYTLSRSERRDRGSGGYRPFDFDQTHILTLVGGYRLPRNWEIGLRWRLVSGNPEARYESGVFDSDQDQFLPRPPGSKSYRLPPFHQLDVRIDKRWIHDTWMLSAYMDIQNVYNRANPEGRVYSTDYSEMKTSHGLPMLAIFGLRAEL